MIQCKQRGAFVTFKWTTWPGGQPPIDPRTGARITDAAFLLDQNNQILQSGSANLVVSASGMVPFGGSCMTRAFCHFIKPTESTSRLFAEIKQGDCILDVVIPLYTVGSPGNTTLAAGQIVDMIAFNAANRSLTSLQTPATASDTNVRLSSLENCAVWIYANAADQQADQHGQEYVQAKIGEELARSWESVYSGLVLGQAILLRKAT
jgi:hypothetical protein